MIRTGISFADLCRLEAFAIKEQVHETLRRSCLGACRLAVVDNDGCLVGIVSLDDLLRLLGGELDNLAEGIKREAEVK